MNKNEMKERILDFIDKFKEIEKEEKSKAITDTFLNGYCYWFAFILKERFKDEAKYQCILLYLPIKGHFVCSIDDTLYDIEGDVTEKYKDEFKYREKEWKEINSIIEGCVNKTS